MTAKPSYEELEHRIRVIQSENNQYQKALKKLNDAKRKYQTFFNNAPDVILVIDTKGHLIEANSIFGLKSGYNKELLIGQNLLESRILTDESASFARDKMKDIIEENTSQSFEIHTIRKNGQVSHYDTKAMPIRKNDVVVSIEIILRNVTTRKRKEIELIEERNLLKEKLDKAGLLSGFIPICSICKNIRDDKGLWNKLEAYIQRHSEAQFSHSICPECAKQYYPDIDIYED